MHFLLSIALVLQIISAGVVLSTIEQPASQEQGMAGDANKSPVNQIPR